MSKLIVALDVDTVKEARILVKELKDVVSFYKIGLSLLLDRNLRTFIDELIDAKYKIFLDYKYSDIGNSMKKAVSKASDIGITFITLQSSSSEEDLKFAISNKKDTKALLVTILTSIDHPEYVINKAKLAHNIGFDGVIAPAQFAYDIHTLVSPELIVVSPGIRPVGTFYNEHANPVTPRKAVISGVDYLVIGRPIIKNESPKDIVNYILKDMER